MRGQSQLLLAGPILRGVSTAERLADFFDDIRLERAFLCVGDIDARVFGVGGADDGRMDAGDAERKSQGNLRPGLLGPI